MLEEGMKAPGFTLTNSAGEKVSLKDFLGKKVVLYFYPKDMTSGCTQEACDFRDNFSQFKKLNAVIVGISPDGETSHKKFEEKYELPFVLLSDPDHKVCELYGVWKEKSMYGRKYMGVERSTFLINEKGKILKIYSKVKVTGHALDALTTFQEA
ncbi:MAG TPA: thioredoxin-dependent thiol peroxidase [Ignavibacteriales bacterium]|nr:thioredoxin-dependent thiol peroxidase [Ignavibacteriales bacterium]